MVVEGNDIRLHEGKLRRFDGNILDIEATAISFSWEDKPTMLVTIKDITQKKRAEHERSRIFELSIDMLCITNFDGYFTDVNPAWKKN